MKLVDGIGFAFSSVSKLAKKAGVSPSTIYVFYKSKEDLLISTYIEIKHRMSVALLKDFDGKLPPGDIIKNIWYQTFTFVSGELEYDDDMVMAYTMTWDAVKL